uniref:Uncharacterized protein n=1 Tax=Rhizophora mucronata TaxID=61149 RepID=A0A2P2Q342_RHIMU
MCSNLDWVPWTTWYHNLFVVQVWISLCCIDGPQCTFYCRSFNYIWQLHLGLIFLVKYNMD